EPPEEQTRNRVIVARITHVQEAQQLLVNEVKPEEAVIFARRAAHGEFEVRWIAQRGENVPRRGDQKRNCESAPDVQRLPHAPVAQLPRDREIDQRRRYGKDDANQALQQQALADARPRKESPPAGMTLIFVYCAEEGPHGERDASGQEDIGNQNAGKQPKPEARGNAETGVKRGAA